MNPRRLVSATTFSMSWSLSTVMLSPYTPHPALRADLPPRWGGESSCERPHPLHELVPIASHGGAVHPPPRASPPPPPPGGGGKRPGVPPPPPSPRPLPPAAR